MSEKNSYVNIFHRIAKGYVERPNHIDATNAATFAHFR